MFFLWQADLHKQINGICEYSAKLHWKVYYFASVILVLKPLDTHNKPTQVFSLFEAD